MTPHECSHISKSLNGNKECLTIAGSAIATSNRSRSDYSSHSRFLSECQALPTRSTDADLVDVFLMKPKIVWVILVAD